MLLEEDVLGLKRQWLFCGPGERVGKILTVGKVGEEFL